MGTNKDDLISRTELLCSLNEQAPKPTTDDLYTVNMCIINAPAVDAVPVVRCAYCKHYEEEPYGDVMMCYRGLGYTRPSDYCSRGERRESE